MAAPSRSPSPSSLREDRKDRRLLRRLAQLLAFGGLPFHNSAQSPSARSSSACKRAVAATGLLGHNVGVSSGANRIYTPQRCVALSIVFVVLTAQSSPPPVAPASRDFCARLATNSGIDKPAASDGRTTWTVDALNFGQRFLFGGSAATGVSVTPVEPATVEDYKRLEDMCLPEGKGAVCKLVGPVEFNFIWKGRKIVTPMAAGERATITVVSTKTTCRSEAP
jgi:hypothetical protein